MHFKALIAHTFLFYLQKIKINKSKTNFDTFNGNCQIWLSMLQKK